MKKVFYTLACVAFVSSLASCNGGKKTSDAANADSTTAEAATMTPIAVSTTLQGEQTDTLMLPTDKDGYISIFDGKTFNGWRGYGKDNVPSKWVIEDGCIKFNEITSKSL